MAIAQHSATFGALRPLRLGGDPDFRSDKSLVKAAKAGKAEAASKLIERHYPRVFSFVSYLTNGKSHAEDLTQEVFTKALGSLGTFNGRYQFEPWLIKIARNLVIDESRKNVHRAAPTDPEELPELESVQTDTDHVWSAMSQQLASSQVKNALARLPLRQRTALVLKEIEEMSYADIALVLGTNVRGVEGTLRRAKARFRLEASAAEGTEGQQAVCKRALRLVALDGDTAGAEASRHLRDCEDCRAKSRSIRASDSLFAVLPALTLTKPSWQESLVANLTTNPASAGLKAKLYRIFDSVKGSSGGSAAAPVSQVIQVASSVAMAGLVSMTAFSGVQHVRETISPSTVLAAPHFSQEFRADPATLPGASLANRQTGPSASSDRVDLAVKEVGKAVPPVRAQAVVSSVVDLLAASLPQVRFDQLPVQSQLNLLAELPDQTLAKIAKTLNLPSVPTEKEALVKAIQEALVKITPPPAAPVQPETVPPATQPPAPPATGSASEAPPTSASSSSQPSS